MKKFLYLALLIVFSCTKQDNNSNIFLRSNGGVVPEPQGISIFCHGLTEKTKDCFPVSKTCAEINAQFEVPCDGYCDKSQHCDCTDMPEGWLVISGFNDFVDIEKESTESSNFELFINNSNRKFEIRNAINKNELISIPFSMLPYDFCGKVYLNKESNKFVFVFINKEKFIQGGEIEVTSYQTLN